MHHLLIILGQFFLFLHKINLSQSYHQNTPSLQILCNKVKNGMTDTDEVKKEKKMTSFSIASEIEIVLTTKKLVEVERTGIFFSQLCNVHMGPE